MEQNPQELFSRMEKTRTRIKELRSILKDALAATPEYNEVGEKVKALRERRKQIENTIKENCSKEMTELEDLKVDLDSDSELMNDLTLSRLLKGEAVEITDQYQNQYEPVFSVRFRKT